ncbi:MAG: CAP domain-containing protein [Candidatus Taylorbacteria bacterium]|nr:CAP domain-containing protein [Candidatus Taylorbacteria bacterium]
MFKLLKSHLHPLGGRIIFWNFILLLLVKLIIPHSAFQSASLLGLTPTFDSREIINATNEARIANNLLELKPNIKLDLAASDKLNDMAIQEYFAHVSPSGVNPWYWIKNSQYQYSVAGENLAIGFITAQDTVKAWLNSSSHRANILNNQYQDIGVAVKSVEINGREGILIVQMFGSPAIALAQAGKPVAKTPVPPPVGGSHLAINSPKPAITSVQIKGESATLAQELSTDNSAEPVQEPIAVQLQDTEKIAKVSELLNNVFSVYVLAITAASAIAFFFFEKSRNMAFKLAFNFAVFALAIIIPATQVSLEGWIF